MIKKAKGLLRFFAAVCAASFMQLPVDAGEKPLYAPVFEGSFLQGWLCRDWTAERWQTELEDMKTAGFRSVILQSAVDLTYEQTDSAKPKTDPDAFTLNSAYALYPTELVPGSSGIRALEFALSAAKETGMHVYIGTVSDSRWWNYGWGVPDEFLPVWSDSNGAQCQTLIREVWGLYGAEYGEQIAGFYYNNEIWNIDAACAGAYRSQYAQILGGNIRVSLDAINSVCPEKPLIISPFYNSDLSSSAEYAAFWKETAAEAQFRPQDIFAHQDGGGRDYSTDTLNEWAAALQGAVGGMMHFWINNEAFHADSSIRSPESVRQNYLATVQAEKHLLFSWNHYYHGKQDAEYEKFMRTMTGDVNADGACTVEDAVSLSRWLMHDRIHVANWLAGDLDADGVLTAADLSLIKRILISGE
ncbi:MAG: DUF4434 domain-containing protein [Oscillospiraceae bacterium]|nr:DUF4434 domain-containing protein [Oscillospiraceae bacterium]